MRKVRSRWIRFSILVLILILATVSVATVSGCKPKETTNFPEQAVTIIVPAKPGGGQDTMTRGIATYLQEQLGVSVLVENVPGPGAVAAIHQALESPADGYTLLTITTPIMVSIHLYKDELALQEPFIESFKPLYAFLTADGNGIVVKKGKYTSIEELVADANTRTLTCAIATGLGSSDHVTALQFAESYGGQYKVIPHGSGGEAVASILGDHTDFGIVSLSGDAVDFSRLDMLAVSLDGRFAGYPDIPTFAELGHPDMTLNWCVGVAALPGTPDDVVAILEEAFDKAFHDPDFQAWATENKKPIGAGFNAQEFTDFLTGYGQSALEILPRLQADLDEAQGK